VETLEAPWRSRHGNRPRDLGEKEEDRMIRYIAALLLALVVLSVGCQNLQYPKCDKSSDCRTGEKCDKGFCVENK
jgi:hypothetical protein